MLFVLCVALAVELLSCFVMFVVLLYLAALTSIVIIVCTVCLGMFTPPFGVINSIWSMFAALPGHILFQIVGSISWTDFRPRLRAPSSLLSRVYLEAYNLLDG